MSLPLPSFRFNCTGFGLVRKAPTCLMSVYFAAERPASNRSEKLERRLVSAELYTHRSLFSKGQSLILLFSSLSAVVSTLFFFCSVRLP